MRSWAGSLYGRTALLIGSVLLLFSMFAWQLTVWTVVVPAAESTVQILTQRAQAALAARHGGAPLPLDTRFEYGSPEDIGRRFHGLAFGTYLDTIRTRLEQTLNSPEIRINRLAAPSEIWVRLPDSRDGWLVLSWRFAGPRAPLAFVAILAVGACIVFGGAALSARRLTAPLAALADAAARVAEGREVSIDLRSGPSEVRGLALAFQSMSHRLTEADEQRELMLAGISHDLRTPLARIRVAVELLEAQDPVLIEEMTASVEEMDRMVGQFLHYVRANYREATTAAVLDDTVRETLGMYGADARLQFDLQADAPRVFAVQCARHTVLNLVQNALAYGRPPVTIRTRLEPDGVCLLVDDCGAGLTDAQWSEAVRPFHRLDADTTDGHTGLGLALADRLLRTCGGALVGQRRDGGFQVRARLPATSPTISAAAVPDSGLAAGP